MNYDLHQINGWDLSFIFPCKWYRMLHTTNLSGKSSSGLKDLIFNTNYDPSTHQSCLVINRSARHWFTLISFSFRSVFCGLRDLLSFIFLLSFFHSCLVACLSIVSRRYLTLFSFSFVLDGRDKTLVSLLVNGGKMQ